MQLLSYFLLDSVKCAVFRVVSASVFAEIPHACVMKVERPTAWQYARHTRLHSDPPRALKREFSGFITRGDLKGLLKPNFIQDAGRRAASSRSVLLYVHRDRKDY